MNLHTSLDALTKYKNNCVLRNASKIRLQSAGTLRHDVFAFIINEKMTVFNVRARSPRQ